MGRLLQHVDLAGLLLGRRLQPRVLYLQPGSDVIKERHQYALDVDHDKTKSESDPYSYATRARARTSAQPPPAA